MNNSDRDFPFRSGPSFLAGFVAFVVVNAFVYFVTGEVGLTLVVGFGLWLGAVLITRLIARGQND